MGGRQAVRPRPLEPVSKVRILPAQPVSIAENGPGNRYIGTSMLAPFTGTAPLFY